MVLRGRRKGLCTLSKVSKCEGFVAFPKTMAGVEAGAVQETCSSELLGSPGTDFLIGVA